MRPTGARAREVVLARLSIPWRASAFGLMMTRSWGLLLGLTAAAAAGMPFLAAETPMKAISLFWLASAALPFLLVKGVVAGERIQSRWTLLFQRTLRPSTHFARALLLGAVLLWCLMLLVWSTFAVTTAGAAPPRVVWGMLGGALLWSTGIYCVGAGLTSLMRRNDAELLAALLVVSYAQAAVARAIGMPAWLLGVISWLLIPIDGMYGVWQGLMLGHWETDAATVAQTFVYPAVWLAITVIALRRLDRSDIHDVLG